MDADLEQLENDHEVESDHEAFEMKHFKKLLTKEKKEKKTTQRQSIQTITWPSGRVSVVRTVYEEPKSRLGKTKERIKAVAKDLELKLARPQTFRSRSPCLRQEHNPRVIYRSHSHVGINKLVARSKSLSKVSRALSRVNPFHKRPTIPPNRVWDNRESDESPVGRYISQEFADQIEYWRDEHAEYMDPINNYLVALNTAELKNLNAATTEEIEYFKDKYSVPPPTPAGSEAGEPVDIDMLLDLEDDPVPGWEHHRNLHKYLINLPVPYSGFYIVPGSFHTPFDVAENMSDYYKMPLIDWAPPEWGTNVDDDGKEDEGEENYKQFVVMFDDDDEDKSTPNSGTSSNDNFVPNVLQRPRSQVPSQAMLVYLLYKGIPCKKVFEMLAPLDDNFLYKHDSRWVGRTKIPEHSQFNDEVVKQVIAITKAEEQWWEKEFDDQGKRMPTAMRVVQGRMRAREVEKMAKKCLENYFWYVHFKFCFPGDRFATGVTNVGF